MQGYYVNTSDHSGHTHSDMHRMHGMPNEMHAPVQKIPVEMMHNAPTHSAQNPQHQMDQMGQMSQMGQMGQMNQMNQMNQMGQMGQMNNMNPVTNAGSSMYNMNSMNVDFKDILKRAVKYLLEGLAVAFVAHYFTKGKLDAKEVIMLGITAAFVFAILDTFSPTISLGARLGAGFGVGQSMFGLNPMMGAAAPMMM